MPQDNLRRISIAYIAVQALIWVKSFAFYVVYGFGKVTPHNWAFFPKSVLSPDLIFHTLGHISIGVLALLYGKNLKEFKASKVIPAVFVAVFLHNVAYWLTNSHPSNFYSVIDFGLDAAMLLSFVALGFVLSKWRAFAKIRVPLLEK